MEHLTLRLLMYDGEINDPFPKFDPVEFLLNQRTVVDVLAGLPHLTHLTAETLPVHIADLEGRSFIVFH